MSRLYARVNSDARRSDTTTRGHKSISIKLFYGNKDDSKEAIDLSILFPEDKDKPMIFFTLKNGIEAKELKE